MLVYQWVGPPKIPKSKGTLMDLHGPGGSCKPGLKLAVIKKPYDFALTSQSNLKLSQTLSFCQLHTGSIVSECLVHTVHIWMFPEIGLPPSSS
jgi:hypothetical protein